MSNTRFRANPLPDCEVVELLESVLAAARRGHVRAVALVTVNPVQLTEVAVAGDAGQIRGNALLGGLVRAVSLLSRQLSS